MINSYEFNKKIQFLRTIFAKRKLSRFKANPTDFIACDDEDVAKIIILFLKRRGFKCKYEHYWLSSSGIRIIT